MFDALQRSRSGERRSEKWAATAGSIALHAALIGVAIWPAQTPARPEPKHIDVQLPAYDPPFVTDLPALPPVAAIAGWLSWPDLAKLPRFDYTEIADPEGDPNRMPTMENLLHAVLATHGGTQPSPAPMVESLLDEAPEVLATPPVRYPPLLREAGIEGTVLLEFVVDTLGHAEPATIRIISSTNAAFEGPAREAIVKSLYRAGRWRGSPVRALSLERVAFSIQR